MSNDLAAAIRELGRAAYAVETSAEQQAEAISTIESIVARLADATPRVARRGREHSTFSGSQNPIAPPMRIRTGELADGRPALFGAVQIDWLREGPPRAVHGGVLAGLFDELLGGAQRLNGGAAGMTGRLTVRYRRPTPLDENLELRAWIHDERRRRVTVRGECVVHGTDAVTAEAEAVFLRPKAPRRADG
ncbi:MAG: hotdog fold domain-containing protein [Acidimicrobiales bacterium]